MISQLFTEMVKYAFGFLGGCHGEPHPGEERHGRKSRYQCGRQKRSFVDTNLARLIKGSSGINGKPRFSYAHSNSRGRPTPTSIISSRNILSSSKDQNMSQSFSNNYNSFNTTYISPTVADDRPNILAWLSPLDHKLRHQDIRDRRVDNVGEWLLHTEEFRGWCTGSEGGESDKAVLFCYGNPGVGKTYIRYCNKNEPRGVEEKGQALTSRNVSSVVIDNLCKQAREQNATVACFYFDFASQNEQSPASILGSLLKQLVFGLEEIPEEVLKAYNDRKNAIGGQRPQISDILKMLQITSTKKRAFICIDALDECATEHQVKLLDLLGQLVQQSPSIRIFVTGRPHILPEMGRRLAGRVRSLSIILKRDDIVTYLHSRLAVDTIPDAMDDTLEADILEKFPSDISEM